MEFEKLQELLADVLRVEPGQIRPEKSFVRDFGADSITLIQIMLGVEATFGILVEDKEVAGWDTVGSVWEYLQSGRKRIHEG